MSRKPSGTQRDTVDRPGILVGLDFSEPSRRALDQALSLARERNAHLLILHVIDGEGVKETAHPVDLSILLTGGKETNKDALSNGE